MNTAELEKAVGALGFPDVKIDRITHSHGLEVKHAYGHSRSLAIMWDSEGRARACSRTARFAEYGWSSVDPCRMKRAPWLDLG